MSAEQEIDFGAHSADFLSTLNEERVVTAESSLTKDVTY
jgi:hypothetical protein